MPGQPYSFQVPEIDQELGLGFYLTDVPGIGGRLRAQPEDFVVREDPATIAKARGEGKYTLATVKARNWETHRLMRELSKRLGVSERSIFFTGSKDKRAVTTQNLAIPAPEEQVRDLDLGDVEILATKRVDRAPKLGEHAGNAFTIRIRELEVELDEALARTEQVTETLLAEGGFPNFFGPQRFGTVRPITHLVGFEIIHERFEEAVWTYVAKPNPLDPPKLDRARRRIWQDRDPSEARRLLPNHLDNEQTMLRHLERNPGDGLGALDRLPRNLQRLFVGAAQSLLFNRSLTRRAQEGKPWRAQLGDLITPSNEDGTPEEDIDGLVPVTEANLERCQEATERGWGFTTGALPGHRAPLADGLQGRLEREALAEVGLSTDDFICHEAPHHTSPGTRRSLWCPIHRIGVDGGTDELGDHITLSFFLPKGSYATCLLREVMKAEITSY